MTPKKFHHIVFPTIDLLLDRGTYTFAPQKDIGHDQSALIYIPERYMRFLQRREFTKLPTFTNDVNDVWTRNARMVSLYAIEHKLKTGEAVDIGDNLYVLIDKTHDAALEDLTDPQSLIEILHKEHEERLIVQAGALEMRTSLQLAGIPYSTPVYAGIDDQWASRAVLSLSVREGHHDVIDTIRKEKEKLVERPRTSDDLDDVPPERLRVIPAHDIKDALGLDYDPMHNQFLVIEERNKHDIYRVNVHTIHSISNEPQKYFTRLDLSTIGERVRNIWYPKNGELTHRQRMALDLLFDDNIKIVFLTGPRQAGKTSIALASAEAQILRSPKEAPCQEQIRLIRSIPGYQGSMHPEDLITTAYASYRNAFGQQDLLAPMEELMKERGLRAKPYEHTVPYTRDRNNLGLCLPDKKLFDLLPPNQFSGINIDGGFLILDEAQNERPYVLEEALSRLCKNGKIIVMGSLEQITRDGLDEKWNGLSVISTIIGKAYVGVVPLTESFGITPTPH